MQARSHEVTSRTSAARRSRRATIASATVLVVALALAGCHSSPGGPNGGVELSGTCQFRACVCVPDDAPFWANADTQPVLWRENGSASCPPGHSLKLGSAK